MKKKGRKTPGPLPSPPPPAQARPSPPPPAQARRSSERGFDIVEVVPGYQAVWNYVLMPLDVAQHVAGLTGDERAGFMAEYAGLNACAMARAAAEAFDYILAQHQAAGSAEDVAENAAFRVAQTTAQYVQACLGLEMKSVDGTSHGLPNVGECLDGSEGWAGAATSTVRTAIVRAAHKQLVARHAMRLHGDGEDELGLHDLVLYPPGWEVEGGAAHTRTVAAEVEQHVEALRLAEGATGRGADAA